ncbi:hypothetical protein [Sorangium atrum]|uniref:Uncharacterized protein n=1 Tax=Sorangium atrum TaxID=2995308 RepID=A0ABT5CG13_9BACT|nr:hypothetical protein [Sorangium aterium]MDC0685332.1 hypothetical protein [Sorangium aterium]
MSRQLALGAAMLLAAFVVCHMLGLREQVSVLSGTPPPAGGGDPLLGVAYALAWFGGVVFAPILAIAAGVLAVVDRLLSRRSAPARTAPPPR